MRQHTDTLPSTNPNVNLVDHFTVHLHALNRSAKTIETYLDSVKQFVELVDAQGMPPQPMNWKREHIEAFRVPLLEDRGLRSHRQPITAAEGSKRSSNGWKQKAMWRNQCYG